MPRQKQPPRLWYRKARYNADGSLKSNGQWLILHAGKQYPTGCSEAEEGAANEKLGQFIIDSARAPRKRQDIEDIDVATVLSVYDEDVRERQANQRVFDAMIARLNDWWGDKKLSAVNGVNCRAYAKFREEQPRGGRGGARRDLETLNAAITHHHKEGLHRQVVRVWLPERGQSRHRWLTRPEVAKLVWYCYRYREVQTWNKGKRGGKTVVTKKRPLLHIARFILLGAYTGTRAMAIAMASPEKKDGRAWIDLDAGLYYRLPVGRRATNKRQPPVALPSNLLSHLRRWSRPVKNKDGTTYTPSHFVEFNRRPIQSVTTGFRHAAIETGLMTKETPKGERVTPHALRHTAATWLMLNGAKMYDAAQALGMSEKILRETYGHHHPDFQSDVVRRFRPQKAVSLVNSLVVTDGRNS